MKEVRALVNATSKDSDYVFISYCHKDKKYVMEDMNELAKNGVVFWYDDGLESGDDWEQKVGEIICNSHCKGMIFYVSRNFLLSKAIIKEIEILNKRLKYNPGFKYFPVFITIKSVYNTLREMDIEEKDFITLVETFPSSLVYDSKSFNNFTHIEKLTEQLNKLGVVKSRFVYDSNAHFKTKKATINSESGLKLVAYQGMEKNLLVPAYINDERIISIGHDCFINNDNIESVVLPEGLIEIGDMAFKNCSALKYISIPTTLEYVGYEAFRDCHMLESVIFPANVKSVGDYCFYKCLQLENVVFNTKGVVKIGYAAFSECENLKKIKLPNAISELGSYCFNDCDALEQLTLPNEIDAVGDYIFINCSCLKCIYINTDKFFEAKNNFENCVSLTAILFTTNNYSLFYDSPKWQIYHNMMRIKLSTPDGLTVNDQGLIFWNEVVGSDCYDVTIKGRSDKVITTKTWYARYNFEEDCTYYISVRAFSSTFDMPSDSSMQLKYDYKLRQFDIDESTKKLVHYKKSGEKNIVIPEGIKIIGNNAFEEANDLEVVFLGKDVEIIEAEAFIRCRKLKSIIFNDKLKYIYSSAFAYCTNLKEIKFNKGFLQLGDFAFACCDELRKIDFSDSLVKIIPERCFYRCIKLTELVWNSELTVFKNSAFRGCSICEFTSLPPNLEVIGETVFSFNTSFKRVVLPSSIKHLASNFLWYTLNVEEVIISDTESFFAKDGVLFDATWKMIYFPINSKTKDYTNPETCHRISSTTFVDCAKLEQVKLNNVEVIEQNNFEKCKKLNKVVIDGSIKHIGAHCFNNCHALKEVVFLGNLAPYIGENCFLNCNESLELIMNQAMLENTKKNKHWKKLRAELENKSFTIKITSE